MIILILLLQQSGVSVQVEVGFSSTVVPDGWNRVTVTVDVRTRPFKGTLEIEHGDNEVHTTPVDQLVGSQRRYWWDFFTQNEAGGEIRARLIDEEGAVAAEQGVTLRLPSLDAERLLIVGPAPGSLQQISPPRGWRGRPSVAATLHNAWTSTSAAQLPTSAIPLLGYDTIVMMKPEELDPYQQEALRRWIELGGRLVLATGKEYAAVRHGFWKELSPVAVRDLTTERVGDDVRLVTVGDRLRGTGILRGAGTRARHGSGEVVFLPFAIDVKASGDYDSALAFWRELLNVPEPEEVVNARGMKLYIDPRAAQWSTRELSERLSRGRVRFSDEAMMGSIVAIAVFLIFVGPISHHQRRRRSGRFVARGFFVALLGVCATVGLLGASYERSEERLVHTVIVDEGLVQTFTQVRESAGRKYAIRHEGAALASLDVPVGWMDTVDRVQSDGARTTVPVGIMRTAHLVSARVVDRDAFGVSCRWIDPQARTIRIRNEGDLALTDGAVVTAMAVYFIGDLAPGARLELDLDEVRSSTTASWLRTMAEAPTDPAAIGLFGLNLVQGRIPARPRQRKLSAAERIVGGEAVFIGKFDRDVTGITVDPPIAVEVRGLLRARVEDPNEGD